MEPLPFLPPWLYLLVVAAVFQSPGLPESLGDEIVALAGEPAMIAKTIGG